MHRIIRTGAVATSALALATGIAACQPNVNEDNTRHEVSSLTNNTWYSNDTRLGAGALLVAESDPGGQITDGAPEGYGTGSLALTTNQSPAAKAQLQTMSTNAILAYSQRSVARDWAKVLESAIANAEHNHELVGDDLRILTASADEGPTLKRFRPRAMGRATRIRKRTSHLTITLTPKE